MIWPPDLQGYIGVAVPAQVFARLAVHGFLFDAYVRQVSVHCLGSDTMTLGDSNGASVRCDRPLLPVPPLIGQQLIGSTTRTEQQVLHINKARRRGFVLRILDSQILALQIARLCGKKRLVGADHDRFALSIARMFRVLRRQLSQATVLCVGLRLCRCGCPTVNDVVVAGICLQRQVPGVVDNVIR